MKFVFAAAYDNYIDANLAAGLLQSENINCWLKDENIVAIEPGLTYAVGGIKLMVAAVQLERALEILNTVTIQKANRQNVCPNCESANITNTGKPRKASGLIGAIAKALLSSETANVVYHCNDCGYEYEAE